MLRTASPDNGQLSTISCLIQTANKQLIPIHVVLHGGSHGLQYVCMCPHDPSPKGPPDWLSGRTTGRPGDLAPHTYMRQCIPANPITLRLHSIGNTRAAPLAWYHVCRVDSWLHPPDPPPPRSSVYVKRCLPVESTPISLDIYYTGLELAAHAPDEDLRRLVTKDIIAAVQIQIRRQGRTSIVLIAYIVTYSMIVHSEGRLSLAGAVLALQNCRTV